MRITYISVCPECGSTLYSDPPQIPDIRCERNHSFASLDEVHARLAAKPESERPLWAPLGEEAEKEIGERLQRMRWKKGPGGDVFVVVRIPEVHAMAIEAEAQRVQKSPDQYFQEIVDLGLERRWFY
jgi:hypothetical protein